MMTKAPATFAVVGVFGGLLSTVAFAQLPPTQRAATSSVRVWQDTIRIPTYAIGRPEPDPLFYTGEQYQGAQRHIYPYAAQDQLTDDRAPRPYIALHLENEYLRITVLPELGGRVFSAVDKANGYDFVYHQHVVKPALIGMLGAWISGGIEWDVFHHHRATTFMPVDYALRASPDGSGTIWVGEQERRQRMRWMVGMTLRPGRAVLDVTVRLINRTPLAETMLYWANVAVHADSQYQAIFPPSVRIATFHGKGVFTTWPTGSGFYAGAVDYTGVDLSWWKNHPSPTSFFAWNLQEDFSGGYDHGRDAGIVHVGDRHVLTGAKLWEWGPGEAGRLWDSRILTDSDGPYAELMVGAYSDNQPDYSWFAPYGVREFTEHWYPVHGIGGFKNATLDGAINLEIAHDTATLAVYATSALRRARAVLRVGSRPLMDSVVRLDPGHAFLVRVRLPPGTAATDVEGDLLDADGTSLVRYRPAPPSAGPPLPQPVRAPLPPADVASNDELIAIGDRAEQINSPSVDPDAYYAEALRRDSLDARANLRAGERFNRRWLFDSAEMRLRRAMGRLGLGYTTPENTEVLYQLGVALRGFGLSAGDSGRLAAARDAFGRAAWDPGSRAAAFHQLAELSLQQRAWARALVEAERALAVDSKSDRGHAYKAMALRHLGRASEAEWVADASAEDDPFDFLGRNELVLARRARGARVAERAALTDLTARMRGEAESYLDLATDYEDAGLWPEAVEVLGRAAELPGLSGRPHPMVHYHLAYALDRLGRSAEASGALQRAASLPPAYCFPFRLESVVVLRWAVERNPRDAHAWYYLGNLLYERQSGAALRAWETARDLEPGFALVQRNLGWAYRWVERDLAKAIASYEAARTADPLDGRIAIELDQAYELANALPEARLAALERSATALRGRSNAVAREALLLTVLARYDRALDLLEHTHFHVEELAGAIHDAFVDAHLLRGLQRLAAKDTSGAAADFGAAGAYPDNLEVGRPLNDPRSPQISYFSALALLAAGDSAGARSALERGALQRGTDGWPETRFYQALALRRLGRDSIAERVIASVVAAGEAAVARAAAMSGVKRLAAAADEAAARRVLGLGLFAKGDTAGARHELGRAVALRATDVWSRFYLESLDRVP